MIALLLFAAAQSSPDTLMKRAANRLHAPCTGPACAPPAKRSPYRLSEDGAADAGSKDRAIAEDGTRCSLVGARVCTGKPRTVLRADVDN